MFLLIAPCIKFHEKTLQNEIQTTFSVLGLPQSSLWTRNYGLLNAQDPINH